MNLDYRPGAQFLVALPGLTFLAPDEQLARRVWAAVGTTGQVDDLLVELVRDGLRATGAFVLVESTGEQVRVLVRGELPVRVRAATGTVAWTGAGVSTWVERAFDRVDDVLVGDADGVAGAADRLPFREGMVRCAGFRLDGTGRLPAGTASPTAVPEVVAIPDVPVPPAPSPASFDRPSMPTPANAPTWVETPRPIEPPTPVAEPASRLVKPMTLPVRAAEPDEPGIEPGIEPGAETVDEPAPEPITAVPIVGVPIDPAQTRTESPDDGFDHLFESTIVRSVEDAAIRDTPDDAGTGGQPEGFGAPRLGDHDGYTITSAELGALRQQLPSPEPVDRTPPARARLEMSTGDVVALDRDVVIGRRPEVDRVQGGRVPTVLTVPSPRQDVSRTHLRIGWSGPKLLATDLHSMNGTMLIGADGTSRALDGGVPHLLAEGDTLDIGDGITLTLRLTSA